MKYILVSIRDRAINSFTGIQTVRAKGEAIRSFIDVVNDPTHKQLHDHPGDFDLYEVGYLDDDTGAITPLNPPLKLANGLDVQTP